MAKKDFSKVNTQNIYSSTIAEATQEAPAAQEAQEVQKAPRKNKPRKTYTEKESAELANSFKTTGRKGVKLPRMNIAFTPEIHDYVKTMSKASGMTYTAFLDKILRDHKEAHADTYQQIIKIRNSL